MNRKRKKRVFSHINCFLSSYSYNPPSAPNMTFLTKGRGKHFGAVTAYTAEEHTMVDVAQHSS